MDAPMEEMALIRRELKAIGININQQTRYFNACKSHGEKQYHADQTLIQFQKVEKKTERLIQLISTLAEKWLRK
ncbi:MAG: plasmid mobilization relaxosome protein MobC [Pedobacter sp.]|nr:MAG: plasmid mobilization relaxosome protein MobC [Pedobacter sp.]